MCESDILTEAQKKKKSWGVGGYSGDLGVGKKTQIMLKDTMQKFYRLVS